MLLVSLTRFVTVRLPICQSFLTNTKGYPCLSKRHQKLITGFFNHSIQVFMEKVFILSCLSILLPKLRYISNLYTRILPLITMEGINLLVF